MFVEYRIFNIKLSRKWMHFTRLPILSESGFLDTYWAIFQMSFMVIAMLVTLVLLSIDM